MNTSTCDYDRGWAGRCGQPATMENGYCEKHAEAKCCSCKKPATHECDYCGQFVCGAPLCPTCEGWNDETKPSGSWGFLNHEHRIKPTTPGDRP